MNKYLIIDKFTISRESLCSLIRDLDKNSHIIEASTIKQAKSLALQHGLIDYIIFNPTYLQHKSNKYMRELSGINQVAKKIIISHCEDANYTQKLITNGADTTISLSSSIEEVRVALRLLISSHSKNKKRGSSQHKHSFVICDKQKNSHPKTIQQQEPNQKLTTRQKEVLDYVTKGYANKTIAYELGVSEGTIKLHVSSILKTLNVKNRTEAAMRASQFFQSAAH